MKWALLSRSLRWVLVVAAAALLAVTWGGGHVVRLAAPDAGPGGCSAQEDCTGGGGACTGECISGVCGASGPSGRCSCGYAVGGIAELPEVAQAPARASASSDRPYAALAGGLAAAAVLALGAGAWYARRWWLR